MKGEAPRPHEQVPKVRDEEDAIVPVLPAIVHALERQVHEQDVGQGIDDLGRVARRIVVLSDTHL